MIPVLLSQSFILHNVKKRSKQRHMYGENWGNAMEETRSSNRKPLRILPTSMVGSLLKVGGRKEREVQKRHTEIGSGVCRKWS